MPENSIITERLIYKNLDYNEVKDDLGMLSADNQVECIVKKTKDENEFFIFISDAVGAEKEILKPLIDLCRKTKIYASCESMLIGDIKKHGCVDLRKLNNQLLDLGNKEFENLQEKKGLDQETLERIGIGKKICAHVFMLDLAYSIKNEKSVKMNGLEGSDLDWLNDCYLDYRNRYWIDTSYFWFRVVWKVASFAAIGAGFIAGLFLVNPVFSLSVILAGIASHYVENYWLRSEKEIYDSKNRLKKLYGILGGVKDVFSKVVGKNKDPFVKMAKFADGKAELKFTKAYSNRHYYKGLFSHLFKASWIFGGAAVVSGLLLIPPLGTFFLVPVVTFFSISLPVTTIVGIIFGISTPLGIASIVSAWLCDKNYKKLKSTISTEKDKIKKEQGEKPVDLENEFWKKLDKAKNSKSPFVEKGSESEHEK